MNKTKKRSTIKVLRFFYFFEKGVWHFIFIDSKHSPFPKKRLLIIICRVFLVQNFPILEKKLDLA